MKTVDYNCKCCGKPCHLHISHQIATGAVDLFTAMYIEKMCYKCYVGS